MTTEKLSIGKLLAENRKLKRTLSKLLDELETSDDLATTIGDGKTASNGLEVEAVRRKLPDVVPPEDGIEPPWDREGFESKDDWVAEERVGVVDAPPDDVEPPWMRDDGYRPDGGAQPAEPTDD